MNVGFRVDGGPAIGMGHIMRCLTLAEGFRGAGHHVIFISRMAEGIDKIRKKEFLVCDLSDSCPETDADSIIHAVEEYDIDILFIDSYYVTKEFFLALRPHVRTIGYIDDVNSFLYPVDILINGNITGEDMGYRKYQESELLLLGTKYNLIRSEFKGLPDKPVTKEVKEIMITTGGTDPHSLCLALTNQLLQDPQLKKMQIDIIVGNAFTCKEELRLLGRTNPNVLLLEDVKHMSEIMFRADIAISAGGSTLYELCACGTPALALILADNQAGVVEKMDRMGYIRSLGWYHTVAPEVLLPAVRELCLDYEYRRSVSTRMRGLVDALGAGRVVQRVMDVFYSE